MTDKYPRRKVIRAIAKYDREVAHPEIYEDLKNED